MGESEARQAGRVPCGETVPMEAGRAHRSLLGRYRQTGQVLDSNVRPSPAASRSQTRLVLPTMMGAKIRFVVGDIHSELAEALVNTVNCVGVMGRGVALQFKKMYPDNFEAYLSLCKEGKMRPGQVLCSRLTSFLQGTSLTSPRNVTGAARVG